VSGRYRVVETYYRRQHFDFWSEYRNPFYSATFPLDMTRLRAFAGERGHPIYASLCYYFTRAMRGLEDFRYRLLDGRIVLYEELHPALTLPAPGGLFTFAALEYHPDVEVFHERARQVSEEARRSVDLGPSEHLDRIYFTALPKVPFTSFTHATHLAADTVPRVAFGKFTERDGRVTVPVSVQVSHVFIDGNALGELVERSQVCFDEPG